MTSGRVLVVANMKPRKLAGIPSEGMILTVSTPYTTKLLRVPEGSFFMDSDTKLGSRVYIEGQPPANNTEEQLNPKKDLLQRCLSQVKIDSSGVARFSGRRLLAD